MNWSSKRNARRKSKKRKRNPNPCVGWGLPVFMNYAFPFVRVPHNTIANTIVNVQSISTPKSLSSFYEMMYYKRHLVVAELVDDAGFYSGV